jgi:hypothetical protein
VLYPVDPEVQLWPDAVRLLGLDPAAGRLVRPVLTRRAFRLGPAPRPVPLRLVLLLSPGTVAAPRLDDLADFADPGDPGDPGGRGSAAARLTMLLGREWHGRLVDPLGRAPDRFGWLAALAGAARLVLVQGHRVGLPPAELAASVEGLLG